jgi:hypothetical protein
MDGVYAGKVWMVFIDDMERATMCCPTWEEQICCKSLDGRVEPIAHGFYNEEGRRWEVLSDHPVLYSQVGVMVKGAMNTNGMK